MGLYQSSVIKKYLKGIESAKIDEAWNRFTAHFHNKAIQENIRNSKEEQYQGEFLIDLFVNVLGYTKNPNPNFNLTTELKNVKGAKKTDGAILQDEKALAVIELKGTKTTDLSKVENQAFGYKNNQPGCVYVITSNFEKLRFYIDNAVDFEEFNLFQITRERFEVLWLCLSSEYLLKNIPKQIKDESLTQEETVTKKLYKDYSLFRNEIFDSIQKNNPDYDKLTLFKKTQKLLDRFLFIFFAEDRLLLPPNSIREIINQWTTLRDELDAYVPLYDRFKKYFGYLNTGHKGKKHEIFAYNGGLFAPDDILDKIKIDDTLLYKHTQNLSNYDFETEVSVNILGHIFEHSLNEIEDIQAELQGFETDKKKSKRKKDGVFYTPKYITKYIVDNTVGKLCEEKKTDLEIDESEYEKDRKGRKKKTLKALLQKLEDYRIWLLELTICDPACGSGAFLNQALEFLINEHGYIDELNTKLLGESIPFPNVENSILENNLFGVDINEESVEIAKLSLWLRTAQKGRKLTSLNNNIKCGNSLIDNVEVAGDKAFNWQKEFPKVFGSGGFDVVIGNPPYVPTEYISSNDKLFLEQKYNSAFGRINLYPIFYEKGILILKDEGMLSFITPYTLLKNQYYKEARKFVLENTSIKTLIDFKGITVFKDVAVDSIILTLEKTTNNKNEYEHILNIKDFQAERYTKVRINQEEISLNEDFSFNVSINDKLIEKISKGCIKVKDIIDFNQGIITGGNKKYITDTPNELSKKVITGRDFNRFYINPSGNFITYDTDKLHRPRKKKIFEAKEKILLRQTGAYPVCAIDTEQYYTLDTVHNGLLLDDSYSSSFLICLLNSKLLRFLYENSINETGKVFAQVKIIYIAPLPIKKATKEQQYAFIDKANNISQKKGELNQIVKSFFDLLLIKFTIEKPTKSLQNWHKLSFKEFSKEVKKNKVKLTLSEEAEWMKYFNEQKQKAESVQSQIENTDSEINKMVYQLYGLSEEEIKIVEEAIA